MRISTAIILITSLSVLCFADNVFFLKTSAGIGYDYSSENSSVSPYSLNLLNEYIGINGMLRFNQKQWKPYFSFDISGFSYDSFTYFGTEVSGELGLAANPYPSDQIRFYLKGFYRPDYHTGAEGFIEGKQDILDSSTLRASCGYLYSFGVTNTSAEHYQNLSAAMGWEVDILPMLIFDISVNYQKYSYPLLWTGGNYSVNGIDASTKLCYDINYQLYLELNYSFSVYSSESTALIVPSDTNALYQYNNSLKNEIGLTTSMEWNLNWKTEFYINLLFSLINTSSVQNLYLFGIKNDFYVMPELKLSVPISGSIIQNFNNAPIWKVSIKTEISYFF